MHLTMHLHMSHVDRWRGWTCCSSTRWPRRSTGYGILNQLYCRCRVRTSKRCAVYCLALSKDGWSEPKQQFERLAPGVVCCAGLLLHRHLQLQVQAAMASSCAGMLDSRILSDRYSKHFPTYTTVFWLVLQTSSHELYAAESTAQPG